MPKAKEKDRKQESSSTGPESPEPEDNLEESESQTTEEVSDGSPDSQDPDLEVEEIPQSGFRHEMTKDKSPEEIDQYVQSLERANQSQGQLLNRLATEKPQERQEPVEEEVKRPEKNFLEDPGSYFDYLEKKIDRRLDEAIKPFRENLTTQTAQGARQQLRNNLRYFAVLEPTIDAAFRERGVDPTKLKEQQLREAYHRTVGYLTEVGELDSYVGSQSNSREPKEERREPKRESKGDKNVNVPQHRPSSAPMAEEQSGKKTRQLTEEERRLARERGQSDEEYLRWQNMEADEVVSPGFSRREE